jgi:hypothetical protein
MDWISICGGPIKVFGEDNSGGFAAVTCFTVISFVFVFGTGILTGG